MPNCIIEPYTPNAEFRYLLSTISGIIGVFTAPKKELPMPPIAIGTMQFAALQLPAGQTGTKINTMYYARLIMLARINICDLLPYKSGIKKYNFFLVFIKNKYTCIICYQWCQRQLYEILHSNVETSSDYIDTVFIRQQCLQVVAVLLTTLSDKTPKIYYPEKSSKFREFFEFYGFYFISNDTGFTFVFGIVRFGL